VLENIHIIYVRCIRQGVSAHVGAHRELNLIR
jgi:hypothetical protein